MQELKAISPIDGRYRAKVDALANYFSEAALIRYRVRVEVEYLIALTKQPGLGLRDLTEAELTQLRSIYKDFSFDDAINVKAKESVINHDVKSVEYLLKDKLSDNSLEDLKEWIHFALTSEDINNLSYALMICEAVNDVMLPCIAELQNKLDAMAEEYKSTAILARTHGQSASPTTFGKEFKVFAQRIQRQVKQIQSFTMLAKLNGATGNYNAHQVAFPNIDWQEFTTSFINTLNQDLTIKLEANLYTTQIESHDTLAEISDIFSRLNTIVISFDQDIWRYISDGWIIQKANDKEVGSSTMPHKVNPIDFENSEGNLGLANALFGFFKTKLPISRLQRDLTDSTVLRNFGIAFAYSLLAYKSTLKGLSKTKVNQARVQASLDEHPEVLAEAIQTVMRREGLAIPYEQLKTLTRGKKVTTEDFKHFIQELDLDSAIKVELSKLEPANYIGIAEQLASGLEPDIGCVKV
ncbi:MAG: adenylosuccinate lyase [Candidatus Melainabacteria bacterium]|jgi:adenylosuccinate lyase|nr:adenylosuccinate lyase [Candidatus Melainabacteria bacterium]